MKNYVLVGIGGYIAPRHLEAIKSNGGNLIASYDPNDSVGIIDRFFPRSKFFSNFENFYSYLQDLIQFDKLTIDFFCICSPNFMHLHHIKLGLRLGSDVICEKPLLSSSAHINEIKKLEKLTNKKVYSILQLRLHHSIIELKNKVLKEKKIRKKSNIDLTYITSRGDWYLKSWKGDVSKSFGLLFNIGVHFFDMLIFLFGKPLSFQIFLNESDKASGYIEFKKSKVRWYLSTDENDLPSECKNSTFRSINIDNSEFEFSEGFTELHNLSYEKIAQGKGFTIKDVAPSIKLIEKIINTNPGLEKKINHIHPYIK